jgi:Kdo2-lipid IVA lauroyltransferase/acyltransferase
MYYIIYGLLYLLSLLPWFMLYGLSDLLVLLVYHGIKYRRDVVMSNLAIAFPEKTDAERKKIAKDFYRLFTDMIVETIKLISLSKKGLLKKYTGDSNVFNSVLDQGKNMQVHAMHNFNWEVVNLNVALQLKHPFLVVYMPVKNKVFERITSDIRKRYGTILIPAPQFKTQFHQYNKERHILTLVADQNPGSPTNAYWLPFFGKMTPFVKGPEKGARLNNTAVAFGNFYPLRRGHYGYDVKLITMNAAELPEGELTRQFVSYLEECIRKYPANYLWSHRRWKHGYSREYETIGSDRM